MGDLNAKVGEGRQGEVVGQYGLGRRNERGDRWVEWCSEKRQVILNTYFKQHPRRRWTWISPQNQHGVRYENQIDYITINHRFRNSITKCKTYPGADGGSGCDHVPVVADMKIKLKTIKRHKQKPRRDWNVLKIEEVKKAFQLETKNRYEILAEVETEEGEQLAEEQWSRIQEALQLATEKIIPEKRRVAREKWMTEEILEIMEERRLLKGQTERYREKDRQIKRKCKERKEEWLKERCDEIEQLQRSNSKEMYEKINELTGKKRATRNSIIKDIQGNVVTEQDQVLQVWEQYIKTLYDDNRGEKPILEEIEGPEIMKEEIQIAMKGMRKGKAVGEDEISVEMLEALEEFGVEKVTKIANTIYESGYIPQQMREAKFIVIPKKKGTLECEKHRTISIISQVAKIILRVIRNRINSKINENVNEEQYGFRKGKGTINAIFGLRMMIERCIEMQKNVYLCFIDFEKAFDTVKHENMIEMLKEIHLDGKDVRLISNLYWDQKAAVEIENERTSWVEIKRGIRQGCVLSPDMFSLYGQRCMEELEEMEGISIGGRNVNNIRYADDTVLIADSEAKLQRLVDALDTSCREKGLKINKNKTEVMGITKAKERLTVRINVQGNPVKQVNEFKYLGSIITEEGSSEKDIKIRIAIAKTAFGKLKKLLTNISMNFQLRVRLLQSHVWSTLLYGCEGWTLKKHTVEKLEAAEMWFLRRMFRVPWTARETNEAILNRAGMQRSLIKTIRRRQLKFLGHTLRSEGLEKCCLLGRVEGRRARGRQRIKYMDSIVQFLGDGRRTVDLIRLAGDRSRWRSMIADVT